MTEIEVIPIDALIVREPSVALLDPAKKAELYAFIENEIAVFVPDLETEKGRKAIAALAYKITRTKAAIDDAGAAMKSEWLKKSQEIDAGRREVREKLDALKEKAREPLTKWEKDEEQRQARVKELFDFFQAVVIIKANDTAESVAAYIQHTKTIAISEELFRDQWTNAVNAQNAAVLSLRKSLAKIEEDEFDRAELERLRKESEARKIADQKIADEAEATRLMNERQERERKRLAELAETNRIAEEGRAKLEAENIEKARKEAEERTRRELEAKHNAELKRIADEETARQQVRLRKEAEQKKLSENKKHRAKVIMAARAALEECGLSENDAHTVVDSIVDGKIPAVTISFSEGAK